AEHARRGPAPPPAAAGIAPAACPTAGEPVRGVAQCIGTCRWLKLVDIWTRPPPGSAPLGTRLARTRRRDTQRLGQCFRATNGYKLSEKLMDKDEELLRVLGKLRGGRLEDIADHLIALFREPAWWEEEFDAKFVARGSLGALQDADKRDAVKSFIRA